jgi:hypothetical protein
MDFLDVRRAPTRRARFLLMSSHHICYFTQLVLVLALIPTGTQLQQQQQLF